MALPGPPQEPIAADEAPTRYRIGIRRDASGQ
jgi:hypothetical protein